MNLAKCNKHWLGKIILIGLLTLATMHLSFAQKITVVTEEYPPYNFLDKDKKITGMSTEVVEEVLKRAKLDYRLDIYPWARAYKMAQEAPNVIIYSIGRSKQREALFKWVDVIAPYDVYLYRLKNRPEIKVGQLDDIKKYIVGAVREDIDAQYLAELGVKLDLTSSDRLNIRKLAIGRIDMLTMDEYALIALYKSEGIDPNTVTKAFKLEALSAGLYMAFSIQTPDEIVNKCKAVLAELKKDGTIEKIRLKHHS